MKSAATPKAGRGSQQRPYPVGTLTFDLRPPELWESRFLLSRSLPRCCFALAAQAKTARVQAKAHSVCDPGHRGDGVG